MPTFSVSQLTSATAVAATDLFEVSQVSVSAYGSRQATGAQIRAYALAAISGYTLAKTSLANVSATTTLDPNASNYFAAEVSGSATFVFTNPTVNTVAAGIVLELTNGGNFAVVWPASVRWPAGIPPELTFDGTDVLVFITDDGGSNWRGVQTIKDSR
jgi:hypothetical protein